MTTRSASIARVGPGARPPDIVAFVKSPRWLNLPLSQYQDTLLRAMYGLPMPTTKHLAIFTESPARPEYRPRVYQYVTVLAGAGSGKSTLAAVIAVYEACFGHHELELGGGVRGTIPVVAQDYKAGGNVYEMIETFLKRTPACQAMIKVIRGREIDLTNGMSLDVFPCTNASLRGYSFPVGIMDEVAFWPTEGAANADREVQASIERSMTRFEHPKIIKISTPYLRDGVMWNDYKRAFGTDHEYMLVWKAGSASMNPAKNSPRRLLGPRETMDPSLYSREFEAEFIEHLEAFLPLPLIEAARLTVAQVSPDPLKWYVGAIDTSGGRGDAFTYSIAHLEGRIYVLDWIGGWTPHHGDLN